MPARSGIERRDTYQAVHTDLALQHAKGIFAIHFERNRFDSSAFPFQAIRHIHLHAISFSPAQVHAEQHLRPILAFRAARTGVHGNYGIARIVLTRKQHGVFQLAQRRLKRLHIAHNVSLYTLAFTSELKERIQIVRQRPDLDIVVDPFFQALAILHHLLAALRLVPEVGFSNQGFGLAQFSFLAGRVKDTSARQQPARAEDCIRVAIRPVSFSLVGCSGKIDPDQIRIQV